MVKRPGLGKRKRVRSDPGDPATQATQAEDKEESEEPTHGRYKKKRLVRMTDAPEDEMAQWLQNHLECTTKERRSTGTWTARRLLGPPRPGLWAWKVSSLML